MLSGYFLLLADVQRSHVLRKTVAEQMKSLKDEYDRLGRLLEKKSLEEIVQDVDLKLSCNATWVVKDELGEGQEKRQILSNMRASVLVPKSMELSSEIYKRPVDNVPYVFDRKAKKSHYCHNLFTSLLQTQQQESERAANAASSVPLPLGFAPVAGSASFAPPPAGTGPERQLVAPQGSPLLPGMKACVQGWELSWGAFVELSF